MKYLSLCLATNGVIEWVIPVIENIYNNCDKYEEWELVVTNNGDNNEFHKIMLDLEKKYENLIYKKTDAYMFNNQIEALKLANGEFLKFINHRSILEKDAIENIIDIVKRNILDKPVIYMSDGGLGNKSIVELKSFDDFVNTLGDIASWTTGVGVWKSDFERIPSDWIYNTISPHSDVLFRERKREHYLVDDRVWCHDIETSHEKKGNYDLYKAFGCEEISLVNELYIDGDISAKTLKSVIRKYENRVAEFYCIFNIMHEPCSYNISNFSDNMGIYLNKTRVLAKSYFMLPKIILMRFYSLMKKGFFL